MKIKQLSLDNRIHKSLHVRRDVYPQNQSVWHYHEEIEFIYIKKGTGTLFVGDSIQSIHPNCCIMIGSNIPHYWLFDGNLDNDEQSIDCAVIHFHQEYFENTFFQYDETRDLKKLINDSNKALFLKKCPTNLALLFEYILEYQSILKLTKFIECLHYFQQEKPEKLISDSYEPLNHSLDQKRMNDVMNYLRENFKSKIELETLAKLSMMTNNSFCRYFKQKTGKTPIQFVSELRIKHACLLLKTSTLNIKEICYQSGFNSFVNFHKIFKSIVQMTPNEYKKISSPQH